MASAFSRFRNDAEDDLEAQVARLSREMSSLRKSMSKRSSGAYDDAHSAASDGYGDLRHKVFDVLPSMRRQASAAERLARDNPASAAVVGLLVVGLLATLFARK